jgi:hypothetical protein
VDHELRHAGVEGLTMSLGIHVGVRMFGHHNEQPCHTASSITFGIDYASFAKSLKHGTYCHCMTPSLFSRVCCSSHVEYLGPLAAATSGVTIGSYSQMQCCANAGQSVKFCVLFLPQVAVIAELSSQRVLAFPTTSGMVESERLDLLCTV